MLFKIPKNILKFHFLLSLIFILSACSSYTIKNDKEELQIVNNSIDEQLEIKIDLQKNIIPHKNIEGKFKFKTEKQNGSGLFSWNFYNNAWLLELKTPINTNIANVAYGDISTIDNNMINKKNIYTWEQLPLVQQGINLSPEAFSLILQNIMNKDKITDVLSNTEWKILQYEQNADNLNIEISKNDNTS